VRLAVFNLLGQEIRVLVDDHRPAGVHRVRWDGRDAAGRSLGTGLYLCRLEAGKSAVVQKMLLAR
jgi:flagellar hook assembly protein FlgD